jgi:hypothetical protein
VDDYRQQEDPIAQPEPIAIADSCRYRSVDETTIGSASCRWVQLVVHQLTVTVKVVVADVFAGSLPVPVTVNV